MELKLFDFIEDVLATLEEMKPSLEIVSEEIEEFFEDFLEETKRGYISIESRVKSSKSLKEKIIRNHYYQKYDTKEMLFANVPDIIGIRLGCKFIEDEADIYKGLKKYFTEKHEEDGYFYSLRNPSVLLNFSGKQPQEQKNGMKIYRIDGKYITESTTINFEMQIKSLVNIFWSEIEHKIIYKNYNYVIEDKFYKDIMKSIKNSLTTIDQQLLLISNQFNQEDNKKYATREEQLEKLISKIIYDIFAQRMKESLGVLVDFRTSCEAIVRYVFRDALDSDLERYNNNLLEGLDKIRRIDRSNINFRERLEFEREPVFKNEYTAILGQHIMHYMNEEFQWNLFFRILFQIEVEDNIGDFETFIHYYTDKIYSRIARNKLSNNFSNEETEKIINTLMLQFTRTFIRINSVDLLYDTVVDQIMKIINGTVDALYKNVLTYEQWLEENDIYLELLEIRLFMLFNMDIESEKALAFLERVRITKSNLEVPKGMVKYIYKL
nr:hypothetical protein [uncultured Cellulosilyticum sp.]